jgi:hypothetical protein
VSKFYKQDNSYANYTANQPTRRTNPVAGKPEMITEGVKEGTDGNWVELARLFHGSDIRD